MEKNIPKPLFVIGDVESSSCTTSIDFYRRKSSGNDDDRNMESIALICGTNYGEINIWSLSTYRCLCRIDCARIDRLRHLAERELSRTRSVEALNFVSPKASSSSVRLLSHFKSGTISVLDIDYQQKVKNEPLQNAEATLTHKWESFQTTFAKCFRIFDNCFAFLSQAGTIHLIDANRGVQFAEVQLKYFEQQQQQQTQQQQSPKRGVVMAIHLFCVDVPPLESEICESQALLIIIAHEDGNLALFRAPLDEPLGATIQQPKSKSKSLEAAQISAYRTHQDMITCIDFNRKTMRGIACSVDNEISIWRINLPETILLDLASQSQSQSQSSSSSSSTESQQQQQRIQRAFRQISSPDKLGIVENRSKRIKLINAVIVCCAIRPDGRIFVTGGRDGRIRVFACASARPLAVIPFHTNAIECVRFSDNLFSSSSSSSSTIVCSSSIADCDDEDRRIVSTSGDDEIGGKKIKKKYLLAASCRDKTISLWSLYNDDEDR